MGMRQPLKRFRRRSFAGDKLTYKNPVSSVVWGWFGATEPTERKQGALISAERLQKYMPEPSCWRLRGLSIILLLTGLLYTKVLTDPYLPQWNNDAILSKWAGIVTINLQFYIWNFSSFLSLFFTKMKYIWPSKLWLKASLLSYSYVCRTQVRTGLSPASPSPPSLSLTDTNQVKGTPLDPLLCRYQVFMFSMLLEPGRLWSMYILDCLSLVRFLWFSIPGFDCSGSLEAPPSFLALPVPAPWKAALVLLGRSPPYPSGNKCPLGTSRWLGGCLSRPVVPSKVPLKHLFKVTHQVNTSPIKNHQGEKRLKKILETKALRCTQKRVCDSTFQMVSFPLQLR